MKKTRLRTILFCLLSALSLSMATTSCGGIHSSEDTQAVIENYTITLDYSDGVSRNGTLYVKKGESVTLPTSLTRKGYAFLAWVDEEGSPVSTDFTPKGNVTLKATWTIGTCLVTFHANYAGGQNQTQTVAYGGYVTSAPVFTRTGYEMNYFSTIPSENENAKVDFSSYAIEGDFDFYVIWRDASIQQYTVVITAGEYDGAPAPTTLKVNAGTRIAKSDKAWKLSRDGYDLSGFTLLSPSNGKSWTIDDYANIATLTPDLISLPYLPIGDTTIYAVWTIQQFTVVWNINYTDSDYQYGVYRSDKILSKDMVERPSVDPTRANYSFLGWYSSALDGNAIDFNTPFTIRSNTGYYAHWKHEAVATKRFQAEYVHIDSTKEYFGYSGSVKGQKCIIKDGGMVGTVDVDDYPTNSMLSGGNGYYVSYQYEKGDVLRFDFTSNEATTAVLKANLCAEYDGGATFSNTGAYAIAIRVNGEELAYSITLGKLFQLVDIATIHLQEGANSIEIEVNNTNAVGGGTYRAAGFNTDYIELGETSATTSWSPIYDNLEHI